MYLIRDEEGKPKAMWAFVRDVTEWKRVEKELTDRIQELEDFYNMTIGRELRMIELREEIEDLREKLGQCRKTSG